MGGIEVGMGWERDDVHIYVIRGGRGIEGSKYVESMHALDVDGVSDGCLAPGLFRRQTWGCRVLAAFYHGDE